MIYSEHVLPPQATAFGICIWRFAVEGHDPPNFTHVIPPDGTVNIAVSLVPGRPPHLGASGPSARAHLVPAAPGLQVAGVRLRPGAAPILLGKPAAALVDQMVPLYGMPALSAFAEAVAGHARTSEAAEQVGEAFLALCRHAPAMDPLVTRLAERLRADPFITDISAVSEDIALSPRQLRRRFVAATGLPPKTFAGIQRLRHAATIALETPTANWAQVAAEAGFADQAHFNRDVARCFGVTPTRLLDYLGTIRHDLV